MPEIPPPDLIRYLKNYNLLPAIVFVPSRRKCDSAASDVARDHLLSIDEEKREQRQKIFDDYAHVTPEIKKHKHREILLRAGVASHHAGHIPSWKSLIEKMMSEGLINALFATSTVAAGVDFPARSVVILNADSRGDEGWRPIEASELQQMTGRAGRRGKDNVGFAILAPGNFQNPPRIAKLLESPPDPLESKFRATYSTLMNLLDAFGSFAQVREIAERSFAFRETVKQIARLERKRRENQDRLMEFLKKEGDVSLDQVFGFERLMSAKARIENDLPRRREDMRRLWLRETIRPGMLVSKGRGGKQYYFVLSVFGDKISTIRGNGRGKTIALPLVQRVFTRVFPIDENGIEDAFYETFEGRNPILKAPKISEVAGDSEDAVGILDTLIKELIDSNGRKKSEETETILWSGIQYADKIVEINRDIEYLRADIWNPFEMRARVLNHFGYLDFESEKLLDEGKWLADLRIDKPLLVGEVLKKGIFGEATPQQAAALMAALVADADRDYGDLYGSDELFEILKNVENESRLVAQVELDFGVEPMEDINFSAAAVTEAWVNGMEWTELVRNTRAEEGDLVRLLSRTGEAIWQVAQLKLAKPEEASIARNAADLVLREPVR